MLKKAFTLLELIVVIVLVSILASLGFAQYKKTLEKARIAEAKDILGDIRRAQEAYRQEYSGYTANLALLAVNAPTACTATHYFSYTSDTLVGTAIRCTGAGKSPNYSGDLRVNITYSTGVFAEDWSNQGVEPPPGGGGPFQ